MKKKFIKLTYLKEGATMPQKMTPGSIGFDLFSVEEKFIPASRYYKKGTVEIGHALVGTGISIKLPENVLGKIASRSGLSINNNIEIGAGWIDVDYRGEIMVEMKNMGKKPFKVKKGDRIAQIIFIKAEECAFLKVKNLGKTVRNNSGLGSTGIS